MMAALSELMFGSREQVVPAYRVKLAETKRFELLKGFTPYLVSSEAHSTGLCDVSKW